MTAEPVVASVSIDAEPGEVFRYFTDSDAIVEWMGESARLEPCPGGEFAVTIGGAEVRGRYLEIEPPHRIVLSWGFDGSDTLPPGSSTVEVRLARDGTGTRVEIVHYGLGGDHAVEHDTGWRYFLDRLASTAPLSTPEATAWTGAEERYSALVGSFAGNHDVSAPEGKGAFGRNTLRVRGKIFAMFAGGHLVVKLPEARVAELVESGEGTRFDGHRGRPMREWFSLNRESTLDWTGLASEALRHVDAGHQPGS